MRFVGRVNEGVHNSGNQGQRKYTTVQNESCDGVRAGKKELGHGRGSGRGGRFFPRQIFQRRHEVIERKIVALGNFEER